MGLWGIACPGAARVNVGYVVVPACPDEVLVEHFVGLNIFAGLMPDVLGRVLTGVVVGGGSQLLHKIIEAAGDLAARWVAPYR